MMEKPWGAGQRKLRAAAHWPHPKNRAGLPAASPPRRRHCTQNPHHTQNPHRSHNPHRTPNPHGTSQVFPSPLPRVGSILMTVSPGAEAEGHRLTDSGRGASASPGVRSLSISNRQAPPCSPPSEKLADSPVVVPGNPASLGRCFPQTNPAFTNRKQEAKS